MESKAAVAYEPPTITTYGTVRELTLGTGGTTAPDTSRAPRIASNMPSGFSCKTSASAASSSPNDGPSGQCSCARRTHQISTSRS